MYAIRSYYAGLISFLPGFGDAGSYPGIQVVATDDGTLV